MLRNDNDLAVPRLKQAEHDVPKSSLLYNYLASFADSYHMKFTYTIDYRNLSKYMDVTFNQLMDMLYGLMHCGLISFCPCDRAHVQVHIVPKYINKANYKFYKYNDNERLKLKGRINNV